MSEKVENIYFAQYNETKQAFTVPLKIKLFFSLLQHCYDRKIAPEASKDLERKYRKFLNAFKHQTQQEKAHFLCHIAGLVRAQMARNGSQEADSNSSEGVDYVKEIETTCKVKDTFMGVAVWDKMNFKFSRKALKIRLSDSKKDFCLKLPHYFVRNSQKHSHTLVFDAIYEGVDAKRQEIYIGFDNKGLCQQIYQHVFSAIAEHTSQELLKLINERQKMEDAMVTGREMAKVNSMLTPKLINEFLHLKQKTLKKLQNSTYTFQALEVGIPDLKVAKSPHKNKERIKLQKVFNQPFDVISKKISLLSRKVDRKLIEYETLEKFSHNISANYFKYKFKDQVLEFLVILEQSCKKGEQMVIFKGIDNFINCQFVDFLYLKLTQAGKDYCALKILGIFQNKQKGKHVNVDFLVNLIQFDETDSTNSGNMDDEQRQRLSMAKKNPVGDDQAEQNFWTVRSIGEQLGDPDLDKDYTLFEKSVKFMKQKSTTNNAGNLKKKYLQDPTEKTNLYLVEHPLFVDWKIFRKGGVICMNQNQIEEQKKVFKNILTQISNNIWARKNIMNISMPVTIFKKQSQLKSVARNFSYAPMFLEQIVKASPLQRIKQITLLQISMATLTISMNKPFNPILGETYQGHIDGCPVYLEQSSHHPPVSVFQFYGRGYKIHGVIEPKISLGLNCVRGWNPHKMFVEFDDGQVLEFTINKLVINGMLFGDRTFNFDDANYVVDHQNHLVSEIVYGKNNCSIFKGKQHTCESVSAVIYELADNKFMDVENFKKASKHVLSIFEGIWHSEIKIDGDKVIDFRETLPYALIDHQFPLPSDCSFRHDVIELTKGSLEKAQKEKDFLEENQRRDKKLREEFSKKSLK